MKLSVTIITLNEEKDLSRCLESVKNFADEIILVDSGSSDKTLEIAKKFGCKVYTRKFDNFASQKNFAAEKATGEWILSIDADEQITPGLLEEIKIAIIDENYSGYSIPRKNIILGKFIKHTRWQPELDRHIWLWQKGKGKWAGNVHEELLVDGKIGKLKNPKIHYQYESVTEFLQMMNKYSRLEVRKRFSFARLIWDPFYNFVVRYFYRLGFLDGREGFVLSYLMAIYHLEVWVKAWEKNR
ncbi:MAG TPA: glycosyltransferase family 2 protein [Patescibacteria group bacterium]|nr:glycosyltransferase family 2 protein [Patescibacteria group bacterium]